MTDAAPGLCEWFALCANEATGSTFHPILNDVPTCDRCHKFATGETRLPRDEKDTSVGLRPPAIVSPGDFCLRCQRPLQNTRECIQTGICADCWTEEDGSV